MPCYMPLNARRSVVHTGKNGKYRVQVLKKTDPPGGLLLPCGQCIGCRFDYSRMWAARCIHEASLWPENSFVTLTYRDSALPYDGSLVKKHFQDFMKRLRESLAWRDENDKKHYRTLRYYMCGEYGEKLSRPHYHALLFNYWPADCQLWKISNGSALYTSDSLESLWGHGICAIGEVTHESAGYCARYASKKITGRKAYDYYQRETDDGTRVWLQPEYAEQSRRPGIGGDWYDRFKGDIFPDDFVVIENGKYKTPRYYSDKYEIENPEEFERIKARRIANAEKHADNNTPERLDVRRRLQEHRANLLTRQMEKTSE